jgi:hypothetical protein
VPDRLKKFDRRSGKIQHPVRRYMMIHDGRNVVRDVWGWLRL